MYEKRIRVFVIVSAALLLVCVLRLVQMQLLPGSSVQDDIARLKHQRSSSEPLKTLRGRILDRNARVLAIDEARFQLCINYRLSSILDERVRKAALRKAETQAEQGRTNAALLDARKQLETRLQDLRQIIEKCTHFGIERQTIEAKIRRMNDEIWGIRTLLAWLRNDPDLKIIDKYGGRAGNVRLSEAARDFEKSFPNEDHRLQLIVKINDIPEMSKSIPLLELKTDDDVFTAQLEFMDVEGIQILPKGHRFYPYGAVAAQTIGWVGPATQKEDKELFANDRLSSYLSGEVCGREDGVEYVCETILRGSRGEEIHDIDNQLASRTEIRLGKDVRLALDIQLQKRIEDYLTHYDHDPNCGPGMAAVVIEVATGDILALVSLPVVDLNRVRYDYGKLAADRVNKPLINRAINRWYPPGSVVKPLILIAGMETGAITAGEVISCPPQPAPRGWPNCWIYNRYPWMGHDTQWPNNNHARNAIKGSCNIYFSRLADRIDPPQALQQWLFAFGYGKSIVSPPEAIAESQFKRNFRQLSGTISNTIPKGAIRHFEQIPPLSTGERRWFGIGQGRLQATPLQVANAMAAIARHGIYKPPQLFLDDPNDPNCRMRTPSEGVDLGISPETLSVLYDGMHAVVSEAGGTAYKQFAPVLNSFTRQDVKIYGKTGSTQPANAWFGGFATDSKNRSIAIAVVVEGGQHGSSDAAPLARDIIQFAIEAGYLGRISNAEEI